jgi:hypothetical protein
MTDRSCGQPVYHANDEDRKNTGRPIATYSTTGMEINILHSQETLHKAANRDTSVMLYRAGKANAKAPRPAIGSNIKTWPK